MIILLICIVFSHQFIKVSAYKNLVKVGNAPPPVWFVHRSSGSFGLFAVYAPIHNPADRIQNVADRLAYKIKNEMGRYSSVLHIIYELIPRYFYNDDLLLVYANPVPAPTGEDILTFVTIGTPRFKFMEKKELNYEIVDTAALIHSHKNIDALFPKLNRGVKNRLFEGTIHTKKTLLLLAATEPFWDVMTDSILINEVNIGNKNLGRIGETLTQTAFNLQVKSSLGHVGPFFAISLFSLVSSFDTSPLGNNGVYLYRKIPIFFPSNERHQPRYMFVPLVLTQKMPQEYLLTDVYGSYRLLSMQEMHGGFDERNLRPVSREEIINFMQYSGQNPANNAAVASSSSN